MLGPRGDPGPDGLPSGYGPDGFPGIVGPPGQRGKHKCNTNTRARAHKHNAYNIHKHVRSETV